MCGVFLLIGRKLGFGFIGVIRMTLCQPYIESATALSDILYISVVVIVIRCNHISILVTVIVIEWL